MASQPPPRRPAPPPALSTAQKLVARAVAEFQAGQVDRAALTAREALSRGAADPDSLRTIASLLGAAGHEDQSIFTFERSLKLRPDDPFTLEEYGRQLAVCEKHEAAIAALTRSIELRPRVDQALMMLLSLLTAAGREDDIARAALGPLRHAQSWNEAMSALRALWHLGSTEVTLERLDRIERLAGPHPTIKVARLQPLLYSGTRSEEEVFRAHAEGGLALAHTFPAPAVAHLGTPDPDRPLRIGYVSQDFRDRSAGHFIEGIITGHDRARFIPHCYHHTISEDALTARLKGAAVWRDIRRLDDADVARQVHADRIDILVDLTGHTGLGRLIPFAFRPAPIQLTYMGYPHTTGLPTIDARLVDSLTDPPGAERLATERLIRLDPCFLCYTPPTHAPAVAPRSPFNLGITFGSFNSAVKLTDTVLRLWARLLSAVPGSRLILKAATLDSRAAADLVARAFSAENTDPSRCTLRGETSGLQDHLAAYADIDIALDPFPYNGTTTTLEALWMGVPVIALAGHSHRARVGVSLLSNLDLHDLIAPDEDDYIAIAAALAADAPRRAALRNSLRDTLAQSAICDRAAFVTRLEAVYRSLWQAHCRAAPPLPPPPPSPSAA